MVVPLLAPLILIAALLVAYAQATLTHSQNTGLVGWLTGKLASLPLVGGLSVKQILKLDAWVTNMLGKHFKQIEARGVAWMASLDSFTRRNAKAALSLGAPVWALAYWLVHTEIGRQAKAHDAPIAKTADHALAVATDARDRAVGHKTTPVLRTQTKTVTKVEHVVMPHAEEWDWLTRHWGGLKKAISLAAVGALAPTLPRVHVPSAPWGLTPTRLRRMLRGLGVPIGVAAMAVAIAGVFRVTPRCVTNGNIGRAMRFLCRSPQWLLDALLLGTVEAFIATDLCEFAYLLRKAAEVEVPALMKLVSVEDALIDCNGTEKPMLFLLPPADPTPLQGVSPLAA